MSSRSMSCSNLARGGPAALYSGHATAATRRNLRRSAIRSSIRVVGEIKVYRRQCSHLLVWGRVLGEAMRQYPVCPLQAASRMIHTEAELRILHFHAALAPSCALVFGIATVGVLPCYGLLLTNPTSKAVRNSLLDLVLST